MSLLNSAKVILHRSPRLATFVRQTVSANNRNCFTLSPRLLPACKPLSLQHILVAQHKSTGVLGVFQVTNHRIHTSKQSQSPFEDTDTKALTVWSNLREVKQSPMPALVLGLSGLIPFVACPLYMITSNVFLMHIATAQIAYGATILSFLGGVRWGFTLYPENPVQPDWVNLGYSVMPSLIAWLGLLLPQPMSLFTMMGGLVFAGYADMAMYGYPPWFKGLRFTLTFVAILSLWTTFMCSFLLPDEDVEEKDGNKKPE